MSHINLNKAIIAGHVGSVEVKYTGDGTAVLNLSVATNKRWTDKEGNKSTATTWHKVVVFGKLAELVKSWVKKGVHVYIEGEMRTRKWQDKKGVDRWTTEIVVSGYNATIQVSKDVPKDAPKDVAPIIPKEDNPAVITPDEDEDIPF